MQTFLPYSEFSRSADCLDQKRLGNQRCEALVLLRGGWPNHPASKMWRNNLWWLAEYGITICLEWRARGFADTCLEKFEQYQTTLPKTPPPSWLGLEEFHRSHRSNLLRKNRQHYLQYFDEPDDLPYIWPGG